MVIIKETPYSKEEIEKLAELFEVYIKTVFDTEKEICCAGCDRHFDCEQLLLENGSKQENLWGGGIDIATNTIDYNSFINIRPKQNNRGNEIQDMVVRELFDKLTKKFFKEVL
ncbi:MAG: DUF5674 family protein [bacterium]|nr:DUF5674 family protein [bacterium]